MLVNGETIEELTPGASVQRVTKPSRSPNLTSPRTTSSDGMHNSDRRAENKKTWSWEFDIVAFHAKQTDTS
jgi:hypothetical protein